MTKPFKPLMPRTGWGCVFFMAILCSLTPWPSLSGANHAEFFSVVLFPFLPFFRTKGFWEANPLRGKQSWALWSLGGDLIIWFALFLFVAFICNSIVKKWFEKYPHGILLFPCLLIPFSIWVLYMDNYCANYFSAFLLRRP